MNIILYKNTAPPNVVNKFSKLKNAREVEAVRFLEKGSLDILNPSILLNLGSEVSDAGTFNYCYIPKFKRYYFVIGVSTEGGLIRIDCKVDVLYSHMKDILNSNQYIIRQETKNNSPYLEDNMLPIRSDHGYVMKPFGNYVDDRTCGRIIMATTGKGGTVIGN